MSVSLARATHARIPYDPEEFEVTGLDHISDDSIDLARMGQLKTALQIVRFIANQFRTLEEIARHIGMTTRTVRRYLYALHGAGVDILVLSPTKQRHYATHTYRLDGRAWNGLLHLPQD